MATLSLHTKNQPERKKAKEKKEAEVRDPKRRRFSMPSPELRDPITPKIDTLLS